MTVAVIGAGPAGLAVAAALRDEGVETVVFERGDVPLAALRTIGSWAVSYAGSRPKTAAPMHLSFSEFWSPASAASTTNRSNAWLRLLLRK